jgi:hypothetical protein
VGYGDGGMEGWRDGGMEEIIFGDDQPIDFKFYLVNKNLL